MAVHTSAVTLPILAFGTEEQRQRFVPELARGPRARLVRADRGRLRLGRRARCARRPSREDDGWRLDGAKQWITNGSHAGTFLVFARTDPATNGTRGISAFLVDGGDVEVTREEEKLGLNSSSTADIRLDGVLVGDDRLLHEEHRGFRSRW